MNTIKRDKNFRLKVEPKLPIPNSTYKTKAAIFRVYKAKDMYALKWRDSSLRKLVNIARTSYSRYGSRSLLDKHDEKAVIYLAQAQYNEKKSRNNTQLVSEWLSVRMVPGDGTFNGVGELELYTFKDTPVTELLRRKIKCSKKEFWQHIISDSRMCGIHPYIVLKNKRVISAASQSHKFTPECMALMQVQFMLDYPRATAPFQYVSAIVRPEIRDKVITLRKGKLIAKPNFVLARETLGLSKNAKVVVDHSAYTYQFPRYWLNMTELKSLVRRLLNKKKISKETLEHYLEGYSLDSTEGEIKLAKMLTARGKLAGASITGSILRALIDKGVSDAPELQIMPINTWQKGFLKMLDIAGINVFKQHPELSRFSA